MSDSNCTFQRGTWECRGDGYLWDADGDGWDPEDTSDPCPCCNTQEYLEQAKAAAETTSFWLDCDVAGTGEDIWVDRLRWATEANPEVTQRILKELGPVHALIQNKAAPEGYIVSINNV